MIKDLRKIAKDLRKQNYTLEETTKGHILVYSPQGACIATLPGNDGSWRMLKNAKADLRRGGYKPAA